MPGSSLRCQPGSRRNRTPPIIADDHTATLDALHPLYRRRHTGPDGRPDTRAIAAFRAAGFTDLWTTVGKGDGRTVPTGFAGREFGAMRLDYLLAGPPLAARAERAWVVRDETTDRASDHYPLRADVDVGNRPALSRAARDGTRT